jgi:hypothetical protein
MTIYNEAKINRKMAPTWLKNWSPKEFGTALRSPFENAAQRNAKLSGRPILKQLAAIFRFILAPLYMVMVRVFCLHAMASKPIFLCCLVFVFVFV